MTILCPNVAAGDTGTVNGVLYTKIDSNFDLDTHGGNVPPEQSCTTGITDMEDYFQAKGDFNEDISHWDVSSVTTMETAFNQATSFNQDISQWDVSNVTTMYRMFREANSFNSEIGDWNVSNVRNMESAFDRTTVFNQDISSWDVSNVTTMKTMFFNSGFNQPIGSWNVSSVTNMSSMFNGAKSFDQDIGLWDVSNVSDMTAMFYEADAFNKDIGDWDISSIVTIDRMFLNADSFDRDLSLWCTSSLSEPDRFSEGAPLRDAYKPDWGTCPVRKIVLTSPVDGSLDVDVEPLLIWNADNRATSYEIQVSANDFTSIDLNTSSSTNSIAATGLSNQQLYNWRVRGQNTDGYGQWSDTLSFTTQSLPPVELSIPDTTGYEGDTLIIPVITSDLSGKNITAIDIDITHDTSMVEIVSVNRSETIFSNVVTVTNQVGNSYRIGGSSSSEINGSGVLIYIHVFLEKDGTSTLELNSTLNEGEVSANSTNGTITISDTSPPDAPSLTTPSDGADDTQLSPTLEWSTVSGATSYSVEISSDNFSSSQTYSTSSTSQEVGPLTYETSYSWRVKSSNENGESGWSDVSTFTTRAAPTIDPPGTPSLSTPTNGADDVLRPIAFSWETAARAEAYTLEVSEDDFSTVALRTTTSSTSYSTSSLAYKTSYSWRVKATNDAGDGDWSEVYSFSMGIPPAPGVVSLVSPTNNASGLSSNPTLRWNIEPYAYEYEVQVSTDNFNSLAATQTTDETTYSPLLNYNESYNWRVKAINDSGSGEWSSPRTFTTEDVPAPGSTILVYPSDTSESIAPDTLFVWQPTSYASSYVIEISSNNDVISTDTVRTAQMHMTLENAKTYSWRVFAYNSKGNGPWSDTWSFRTIAIPIKQIELLRPSDNAANISTSPNFTWHADTNASSYQFQLSADDFDSIIVESSSVDTNTSVSGLVNNSTYKWRVRGLNDGVNGAWSEQYTFTTAPPSVSTPVIIKPARNADSVAIPTEFAWEADKNASSYEAELFTDALTTKVFEITQADTSILFPDMISGKDYLFRVRALNSAGASNWSNVEFKTIEDEVNTSTTNDEIPTRFSLEQNHPNPFNPTTTITYSLPQSGMVTLNVYDITGRFITTLVNRVKGAGVHTVEFDASTLSSGLYVYTLETDGYMQSRQMMMVK